MQGVHHHMSKSVTVLSSLLAMGLHQEAIVQNLQNYWHCANFADSMQILQSSISTRGEIDGKYLLACLSPKPYPLI
jgi:hypothetical protein